MVSGSSMTIGWIGVGRMGFELAKRLLEAGYDVTVYNRTRSKAEPLAAFGAKIVDHPVGLADRDVVFSMVSAPKDLDQVMTGDNGLLTNPDVAPKILIDSSTVSQAASAALRATAKDRGAELLAAPVSGNPSVIAAGKLTLAASGPRETFDTVADMLGTLGRGVTYVGDGEVARLVKIAHNVFLGVVTQSMAEITVLAERGGVSRAAFLDFLNDSVMGSVFTQYKTPAFVNLDFAPTFTNVLLHKDLNLGLEAAQEMGVPMPLTAATGQIVQSAISVGHVEDDFATLLVEQARLSGYEIKSENNPNVRTGLETDG